MHQTSKPTIHHYCLTMTVDIQNFISISCSLYNFGDDHKILQSKQVFWLHSCIRSPWCMEGRHGLMLRGSHPKRTSKIVQK